MRFILTLTLFNVCQGIIIWWHRGYKYKGASDHTAVEHCGPSNNSWMKSCSLLFINTVKLYNFKVQSISVKCNLSPKVRTYNSVMKSPANNLPCRFYSAFNQNVTPLHIEHFVNYQLLTFNPPSLIQWKWINFNDKEEIWTFVTHFWQSPQLFCQIPILYRIFDWTENVSIRTRNHVIRRDPSQWSFSPSVFFRDFKVKWVWCIII